MVFELKSVFLNDGQSKQLKYDLNIADLEIDGGRPFTTAVSVTADAFNRTGLITLELTCTYGYSRPCDRCGELSEQFVTKRFTHKLAKELVDEGNDDYIETPDFTIELDEIVVSDILLNLPQKYLCKEDCKGLCPVCGQNLNKGECDCEKTAVDPRLEILKQLMEE